MHKDGIETTPNERYVFEDKEYDNAESLLRAFVTIDCLNENKDEIVKENEELR